MSCALLTQILDDIKTAMKAHDAEILGTLRTLHSDIKNEAMKSGATPAQITESITDAMCIDVLAKSVKQKQESIEILKKGGFLDKIPAEEAVIAIYRKYMPAEMTEDEVKALIAEIKAATGASSPKDMGKIMKELSPKVKGRFDAKRASALVQEALK
ncbi:GatB/YqeY domain-containing protein [uncultured Fibrobacter sp.]|uniref:GatB/YqeY domain-containing protein n=1 Tax=uncultured Fibrobacter sp. TaxID=261512 RepID=UPI0025D7EB1B|nr:GatB/YqeY domain-containing protein [uncultured Fibrobacter sp.]